MTAAVTDHAAPPAERHGGPLYDDRAPSPRRWAAAVAACLAAAAHLPVLVDHVREAPYMGILFVVFSLAALAVGADGIHVEVHPSPATALSDNEQQLDFAGYERFMDALTPLLRLPVGV